MDDEGIIALYFQRDQQAVAETAKRYGDLLFRISFNVLANRQDAEECVNDAYRSAWEHIPPARPRQLSVYLGRIVRRVSIDRWREQHARKRGGGQLILALDELEGTLSGGDMPEELLLKKELAGLLNTFLRALPDTERRVFIRRYWYLEPVRDIARDFGFSSSKVKSMLARTRKKLKKILLSEGGYDL